MTPVSRTHRVPLGSAYDILEPLLAFVQSEPQVAGAWTTGSLARGDDQMDAVELLVSTEHPARLFDAALTFRDDVEVVTRESWRLEATIARVPVRIECAPPREAGVRVFEQRAHPAHLDAVRRRAEARGLRLTRAGLTTSTGALVANDESGIYAALDLPTFPPELRANEGEFTAAEGGRLPAVLRLEDIRGDLHMHSLWSDGRDAIEAMVVTSLGLGYEYIAITDHSQSSRAVRNLTRDVVARQADEIASLREQYPGITILHGCEVDIMEDGTLDFGDDLLQRFDIVLASLHDPYDHDAARLLRRYERAVRHPLVSVVTHPTNRLVSFREGYDLDYDRLFTLARETGTCLEIDGAPSHLDLDSSLARRAVEAGVRLTVDSDCHRASALARQMQLGVVLARRGWVDAPSVLNTRPLTEVRAFIAAKRNGAPPPA